MNTNIILRLIWVLSNHWESTFKLHKYFQCETTVKYNLWSTWVYKIALIISSLHKFDTEIFWKSSSSSRVVESCWSDLTHQSICPFNSSTTLSYSNLQNNILIGDLSQMQNMNGCVLSLISYDKFRIMRQKSSFLLKRDVLSWTPKITTPI